MSDLLEQSTIQLLNGRSKELDRQKYAYRIEGGDGYGMDMAINEDPVFDEAEMSMWIPYADSRHRDGVGDLLEVGGIDVSRHVKNPVCLFDHGKSVVLPIGLAENPKTGAYENIIDPVGKIAKLNCRFYQGKGIPGADRSKDYDHAIFCEQLYDLATKKFLRGGSLGYQVKSARELPPDYETGTPKGLHLMSVLMLEGSLVVMPANADTVAKALSLPSVCGKPLSPMLVKSLSPYAPEKKVMLGWEGKSETVPVPLDNIPDTKIPPPEWKPGVGAEKSLSAVTALILGALSAGTAGWTLAKLMGWLSDHGVDEAEAQLAIMDLQKRGNLEVDGENIQKKELPRQEFKGFNFNAAVEAGLSGNWDVLNDMIQDSGKTRSQADSIVEALKLDMDVTSRSGEWSNDQNRRSLISSKLRKAGLKSLDSEKKAFGIDDAIILGLVGAGSVGLGWLIRKIMRYADGLDQEDANSEIMRLEREGRLRVSNGQVSAKGLYTGMIGSKGGPTHNQMLQHVRSSLLRTYGTAMRSQIDEFVRSLKANIDHGDWSEMSLERALWVAQDAFKDSYPGKGLQKKALVDDPTADYRVVAVGANGERVLYRGPDKEIAYRLAYQAKKSDLYNSVVLHGEVTGPRRMKSLRGRYGKPQSKALEVRFEWRENPSGTPWERRKIWVRDGGSERQMSFTDLAQQYGQEVAKRMISTSIRKGTSNWHEVPGVKSLPRQGTKSLDMSSVRKKYRPTKTLRRRLRKSVPGSSLVHVAPSDLNAAREMAEAKGLKFDHVGSVGGLSRVKLMGDDSGIDAVAQEFGKSVRGRKSFPLQGEKGAGTIILAGVLGGAISALMDYYEWRPVSKLIQTATDLFFEKNPPDPQQRERLRKQKEQELLQYFEDLERQGKVEIQGGKIRKRKGGKSLPLTGIKRCVVEQESDGWYARFSPEGDGAPDYRQDMGPFESEQEARQIVTRQFPGLFIHRKGISRKDLPTVPIPARIVKQFLYGMLSRQQAVAELVAKAGMTPEQAEAEIDAVVQDIRSKERKGIKSTGDTEFNQGVAARLSGEQQNDNPYPIGSEAADSWNSGWVGGQGKMMKKKDMSTRGSIDLDGDVRRQIDNTGQTLNYAKPGNGGHYLFFAPGTDIFKVRTALEQGGHVFKITGQAEGWVKPRAKSLKAKGKSMDNTDDVYMDDDPLAEASKDMGMNPEHPFSAQVLKRLHEKSLEDLEEFDGYTKQLEHPEISKHLQKYLEGKAAHLDEIEALHAKHHPDLPGLGDAETKDLDEEELGETEGELDAIGDELDDVAGDLDEEFDDTEEDKDLDTIDRDAVPADSDSEDEPTPEEALEGMETADGVKHLRRRGQKGVVHNVMRAVGMAQRFPVGGKVRIKPNGVARILREEERDVPTEGVVEHANDASDYYAVKWGTGQGKWANFRGDELEEKSLSRRRVKSLKDEEFDEEFIGKRLRRKGIEEIEELTEDEKQLIRRKRMERRMKSACPECGGEDCDCTKSMDGPPPEFTDQIDNGIEAMEEKGLEDHEMAKVGEAAQFANELATTDVLDEEKRMKSYHYKKTLEGMGQIEDLAAEQKSEFVGDPQFWQEEGAEAEHKDMGTEHPGAMAGSAEEAAVNGPAAEAQIPPAKSIHPHRQACKDAARFFGDTASTKDWGRPHQEHASVVAKALEEVAAAPINKPEPVTDEAVIEVGEMGEKSRRFLRRRRKSVDELKKEEEEAKALRKNLIEQQKQVKELRRMINGIGNMTR